MRSRVRTRDAEAGTLDAGCQFGHRWPDLPMQETRTPQSLQTVARGLARLSRLRARAAARITPQQAEALQLIADHGALSISSLALRLGIDPSTASRNLAGLERAGYIVRRRGKEDSRLTDAYLTARGKRIAEAVCAEWTATYVSLLERMPRLERQRIADALELLAHALEGRNAK
jgi:DNA-binding MarR family transcriptional regulator